MSRVVFWLCSLMFLAASAVQADQVARKPMLGIKMQAPSIQQFIDNKELHPLLGVHIVEVIPGTVAEQSGLRSGDIITALDRAPVRLVADVARIIAGHVVGDVVTVHFLRPDEGKVLQRQARLDQWLENVPTTQNSYPINELWQRVSCMLNGRVNDERLAQWRAQISTIELDITGYAKAAPLRDLMNLLTTLAEFEDALPAFDCCADQILEQQPNNLSYYITISKYYSATQRDGKAAAFLEERVIPRLTELATERTLVLFVDHYNNLRRKLDPQAEEWQPQLPQRLKLGITVGPPTVPRSDNRRPDPLYGVEIYRVKPEASEQGLQDGDIVLAVNGKPVNSVQEYSEALQRLVGDDQAVQLKVYRPGAVNNVQFQPQGMEAALQRIDAEEDLITRLNSLRVMAASLNSHSRQRLELNEPLSDKTLQRLNQALWNMHVAQTYWPCYPDLLAALDKATTDQLGYLDTIAWVYADHGHVTKALAVYEQRLLPRLQSASADDQRRFRQFYQKLCQQGVIRSVEAEPTER